MNLPIRFDAYFFAPKKIGVQHFGTPFNFEIKKDTPYVFLNIYKEMLLGDFKVTTSEDLAAASLKFNLYRNEKVIVADFFASKSIATAATDAALTVNAAFVDFKPNKFTLADCFAKQSTLTVDSWDLLQLGFVLTGADPTATLKISIMYEAAYRS